MTSVIVRDHEESGRGVARDLIGNAERAGIDDDLETGAAIYSFDRIGGGLIAGGWAIHEHGGNFAAGGKTHHPNTISVDIPF